jgi:hypothetical protein
MAAILWFCLMIVIYSLRGDLSTGEGKNSMQANESTETGKTILGYGCIALAGLIGLTYLAKDGWPSWMVLGWLCVVFLASWGMGWSAWNLGELLQKRGENQQQKAVEVWLWLVVCASALSVASWKLGIQVFTFLPALILLSGSIALLKKDGLTAGLIWGVGIALQTSLGWAAIRESLFQSEDSPAWFLASFLVLWLAGSKMIEKSKRLVRSANHEKALVTLDWARILRLLSIASLFFLGQTKEMGIVYGIAVFLIFVISERQFRVRNGIEVFVSLAGIHYWVGGLLLLACLLGRTV